MPVRILNENLLIIHRDNGISSLSSDPVASLRHKAILQTPARRGEGSPSLFPLSKYVRDRNNRLALIERSGMQQDRARPVCAGIEYRGVTGPTR